MQMCFAVSFLLQLHAVSALRIPAADSNNIADEPSRPLVLVIMFFGNHLDSMQATLFIHSLANSNIDLVFLGDAAPSFKPANVHHVPITWEELRAWINSTYPEVDMNKVPVEPGDNARKVCDLRPLLGLMMNEKWPDFKKYQYWGWSDTDTWVTDTGISELMGRTEDVWFPYSSPLETTGPLQIFHNTPAINTLLTKEPYRQTTVWMLERGPVDFDENGCCGGAGIDYSMSGILQRAINAGELTYGVLKKDLPNQPDYYTYGDHICDPSSRGYEPEAAADPDCGYCVMTKDAHGTSLVTKMGAVRQCHFIYSKRSEWYQTKAHYSAEDSTYQALLHATKITSIVSRGVFVSE